MKKPLRTAIQVSLDEKCKIAVSWIDKWRVCIVMKEPSTLTGNIKDQNPPVTGGFWPVFKKFLIDYTLLC